MKGLNRYLLIFAALLGLVACKNESKTTAEIATTEEVGTSIPANLPDSEAGKIVKKAIEFSGGWQHWRDRKTLTFTKKMQFYDSLGNQIREENQLHRYQLRPSFKAIMTWEADGIEHEVINNGKQAWKLENGEVMTDKKDVNSAWNSSFGSHYVISMPFKLNDPGTILEYQGLDTLANKQVVHSIKTTYRKGAGSTGGMHTWWYYFDKDTFEPAANFLDYGEGHSYTQYETFTDVDGIKLTNIRKSYRSNANRDLLSVGTIYTNENIRFNEDFDKGLFEIKKMMVKPKVLIAGVGNELKQDDAFGIEFMKSFEKTVQVPDRIKLMEVGIGGIHLVQELHYEYDVLVMVDAVEWGEDAGHVYFREMESVADIEKMPVFEKRTFLADMHYTNPIRALMLAKALKVLPQKIYILGCEAAAHDDFAIGMSKEVTMAIPKAIEKLKKWLQLDDCQENSSPK